MTYRSGGTTRGPLHFIGITSPGTAPVGQGYFFYDSVTNTFQISENGSPPVPIGQAVWNESASVVSLVNVNSQVGIGTSTPTATTKLEVDASAGGFASAAIFLNGTISAPDLGSNSERFGANTAALGTSATALGNGASASGTLSLALGSLSSTAGFTGAIALGVGATNDTSHQLMIGSATANAQISLVVVGNGSTNSNPQNVMVRGTNSTAPAAAGASVTIQSGSGNGTSSGGTTTINAGAGGLSGNGGNVVLNGGLPGALSGNGGEIVLRTAPGSGMPLFERLRISDDGAQDTTGLSLANQPAVSAANHGRLYYDSTSQQYMVSLNGAPYTALATSAGSTLQSAYVNGQTIVEQPVGGSVVQTPVSISNSVATATDVLQLTKNAAAAGSGLAVTMGATTTGNGISVSMTAGATGLAGLFSGGSISCPASTGERFGSGATITGNSITGVAIGVNASLAPGDFNTGIVIGPGCSVTEPDVVLIGSGNTVAFSGCVVLGRAAATTANDQFVLGPAVADVYLGNTSSAAPQPLTIHGVTNSTPNSIGGPIAVQAGAGNGSGAGGVTTISGGPAGSTGIGGGLVLTGAPGGSTSGSGGSATLTGGSGTSGGASGGPVAITGGAGQGAGSGASITLSGGIAGSASGLGGEIVFRSAAAPAATTLFERFRVTNDGALNATGIASASEPADPSATDGRLYFNSDRENFRTAALAGGTGAGYQDLFRWVKVTKAYTDFSAAAPTNSITGYTLPAGAVIHAVKIFPTTSFTGGGLTSYRIEVGVSGVLNKYASSFLVSGAVSGTNFQVTSVVGSENQLASTPILFTATGTGANLDQATQGSVDIYVLVSDAGF